MAAAYLVDANVLSEATRPTPDPQVVAWLRGHESECVVDAVILGEILAGVLSLPRSRKRKALERWFEALAERIECLPFDATVARQWARLVVDLRIAGQTMPLLDSLIAASALVHDLVLVTRNVRDFENAGVQVLDPFQAASP